MKKIISILGIIFLLSSCGNNNQQKGWSCIEDGTVMYSMDEKGNLGGAQKGCSCEEIYNFEMKTFGEVDIDALKSDFGCNF